MHCGAVIVALTGIGCATIAGLGEDFEHAPVCNPIVAPAASKVSNAGDTIEFVVAIHTIDLDKEDDTPRYGYNMDGKVLVRSTAKAANDRNSWMKKK